MSTIKNRVAAVLAGKQMTRAELAAAAGVTVNQAKSAIMHLRATGDVCTVGTGPRAIYELSSGSRSPARNLTMVQHALSRSAVSVFQLGALA